MNRLEDLKQKAIQVDNQMAILNNDLKRLIDQLKEQFGINLNQASKHLAQIEEKSNDVEKKIDRLHLKAEAILRGIEKHELPRKI